MTPDQIPQLRTLLFEIFAIADNDKPLPVEGEPLACFPRIKGLANQALVLLPCPTCNGMGVMMKCVVDKDAVLLSQDPEPCPDCQPRTCVCYEEITKENAYLHRNCGK